MACYNNKNPREIDVDGEGGTCKPRCKMGADKCNKGDECCHTEHRCRKEDGTEVEDGEDGNCRPACKGEDDQCTGGEDVCCNASEFQCYKDTNPQEIANDGEDGTCLPRCLGPEATLCTEGNCCSGLDCRNSDGEKVEGEAVGSKCEADCLSKGPQICRKNTCCGDLKCVKENMMEVDDDEEEGTRCHQVMCKQPGDNCVKGDQCCVEMECQNADGKVETGDEDGTCQSMCKAQGASCEMGDNCCSGRICQDDDGGRESGTCRTRCMTVGEECWNNQCCRNLKCQNEDGSPLGEDDTTKGKCEKAGCKLLENACIKGECCTGLICKSEGIEVTGETMGNCVSLTMSTSTMTPSDTSSGDDVMKRMVDEIKKLVEDEKKDKMENVKISEDLRKEREKTRQLRRDMQNLRDLNNMANSVIKHFKSYYEKKERVKITKKGKMVKM